MYHDHTYAAPSTSKQIASSHSVQKSNNKKRKIYLSDIFCKYCFVRFETIDEFEKHIRKPCATRKHFIIDKLPKSNKKRKINLPDTSCEYCYLGFETTEELDNHRKICATRKLFIRHTRLVTSPSELSANSHHVQASDNNQKINPLDIFCEYCSLRFKTTEELDNHWKTCATRMDSIKEFLRVLLTWDCLKCSEKLDSFEALIEHVLVCPKLGKRKTMPCEFCFKKFETKKKVKKHKKTCKEKRRIIRLVWDLPKRKLKRKKLQRNNTLI